MSEIERRPPVPRPTVWKSDEIDEKTKANLLEAFKEAESKEVVRKGKKFQKELQQEYVGASQVLGQSPFFLAEETLMEDKAELIWIKEYKSDIADFTNWHARSIYFYDPAGNILELVARFDLKNKADQPFSSSQFLSVSEIGLVFKEETLSTQTEELIKQYHLSWFDKQPPLPQFKAVGDDEGLFIIVPEKRNWFPTTIPSGMFPMKLRFENAGMEYELSL